jgi:hypothetical protein
MHSNGTIVKYADTSAMTSATTISNLSHVAPGNSVWSRHDRKLIASKVRKRTAGVRSPGDWTVTAEYDKTQHAALTVLHELGDASGGVKYWQIEYPDGGKSDPARGFICDLAPPEANDDGILETVFAICFTEGEDGFTAS